MKDLQEDLLGVRILKVVENNGELKLTLDNGKVLTCYQNKYLLVNSNNYDFNCFDKRKFNENILKFTESPFFSLSDMNSDKMMEFTKEDLLECDLVVDVLSYEVLVYLKFPIDILRKRVSPEMESFDEYSDEEIESQNEKLFEMFHLNLERDKPKNFHDFLSKMTVDNQENQ